MGEHKIGERPSEYQILDIPDRDALALQAVVSRLETIAGDLSEEDLEELEDEEAGTGTGRIRFTRIESGRWKVEAHHLVGVIHAGDTTIEITPKIPLDHLMYLAEEADVLPKSARERASAVSASSLRNLVIHWFLEETERLLSLGLVRDYQEQVVTGETWGGTLDVLYVTDRFYQGTLEPRVTTDRYTVDSALNRVLRAGIARVASSGSMHSQRARRLLRSFAEIGALRPADLRVKPSRSTRHYTDAWRLAKQVLSSIGRAAQSGQVEGWSFVFSTPDLVEQGIRSILRTELGVSTDRRTYGEGEARFNPDLVFGEDLAVGDVKYKVSDETDWTHWRGDLYQSLAFATAARVKDSVIVRFSEIPLVVVPVVAGDTQVSQLVWRVGTSEEPVAPSVAREELGQAALEWWNSL
jgi:5-methylcytosine-specific restriction endonuclease McrBC regulatory subunit McrC